MNGDNGDALVAMSTRNQKKNGYEEPKLILNNQSEEANELQGLVRDRIFHDFVENVVDPDQGPLKDDVVEDEEFVPDPLAVENADDGGSSEEEFDKAEEDEVPEDTEGMIPVSQAELLAGVPPVLAKAYKKRFPNYWRTQQALVANSGRGYDQEDDPDFVEEDEEESSEGSDVDDVVDDDDDELGAEGDKVKDLANMVEDMTIPDEAEDQDAKIDEEEGDDSVDVAEEIEMSVVQELADETLNDYKSDEDPDFEPVEAQENSSDEEESELSSIDEDDEAGDDASAGEPEAGDENMVE